MDMCVTQKRDNYQIHKQNISVNVTNIKLGIKVEKKDYDISG
jgi:hypothetical protein